MTNPFSEFAKNAKALNWGDNKMSEQKKIFFTSDPHFGHRNILCFSPSRIAVYKLDVSVDEVLANYEMLQCDITQAKRGQLKAWLNVLTESMDRRMLEMWNDTVGFSDAVYCLGDVSFHKSDKTKSILDRLHGKLHLIRGNHDEGTDSMDRWESVKDYDRLSIDGQKIVLFHYPIKEWDGMHKGYFRLHGHVHGKEMGIEGRILDVAPESTGSLLIDWEEVKRRLIVKPIMSHHDAEREKEQK